jgi:hypothetical protein
MRFLSASSAPKKAVTSKKRKKHRSVGEDKALSGSDIDEDDKISVQDNYTALASSDMDEDDKISVQDNYTIADKPTDIDEDDKISVQENYNIADIKDFISEPIKDFILEDDVSAENIEKCNLESDDELDKIIIPSNKNRILIFEVNSTNY